MFPRGRLESGFGVVEEIIGDYCRIKWDSGKDQRLGRALNCHKMELEISSINSGHHVF